MGLLCFTPKKYLASSDHRKLPRSSCCILRGLAQYIANKSLRTVITLALGNQFLFVLKPILLQKVCRNAKAVEGGVVR